VTVLKHPLPLFLLSLAVFHLAEEVPVTSDATFMLKDYGKRLIIIALCFWFYGRQLFANSATAVSGASWQVGRLFISSLLLLLPCMLVNIFLFGESMERPGHTPPKYPVDDLLFAIDMTIGLVLVAVSEELVFRKLARDAIRRISRFGIVAVVISALAFASIHISNGPGDTLQAFVIGIIFMSWYVRNGRLVPLIVAHYFFNLLIFTGQIDYMVERLVGAG